VAAPPGTPGDRAAVAVERRGAAPARVAAPSSARSAASPARSGPPAAAGERAARSERARLEGALAAARAAWGREQADEAARHYGLALELGGPNGAADATLAAEDYLAIALLADYECLALPEERVLDAYECFAERAGRADLRRLPDAPAALHRRLALARRLATGERLARAYADLLDYAIVEGDFADLPGLVEQLRADRERRQLLTPERHFYLLDALYPSAVALPELRGALADEYEVIVVAEAAATLRARGQLPAYVDDVLNALLFLRPAGNYALRAYIREQRAALADGGRPLPEQEIEQEARPDLARLRLALVGGHSRARSAVIEELRRNYGLQQPVEEVPPSSEGSVNRRTVQERLATSTLAAVIPGYMGHDLSEIVRRLEAGPLRGRVRWLTTRGKSGVVRELLAISRARA
jgi:hypothetical protein